MMKYKKFKIKMWKQKKNLTNFKNNQLIKTNNYKKMRKRLNPYKKL